MIPIMTFTECSYYYRSEDANYVENEEKQDPFFANPHLPLPPIEIPEALFAKIQQAFLMPQ